MSPRKKAEPASVQSARIQSRGAIIAALIVASPAYLAVFVGLRVAAPQSALVVQRECTQMSHAEERAIARANRETLIELQCKALDHLERLANG